METVNLSKKNVYPETGTPDGPQKRGRKAKGDEVVLAPPPKTKPSVNVPADSGSAPEEKQNKPIPVKKKDDDKRRDLGGIKITTDKFEKWWDKQNIQFLKNQAELRGKVYSDLETKGYKVKNKWKEKPYNKTDYLRILKKMMTDAGKCNSILLYQFKCYHGSF